MLPTLIFLLSLLPTTISSSLPPRQTQNERFTFYPLKTPLSGPCDLAVGPDGALWGEAILVNHIFRVDPKTGHVEEYPIPFTTPINNETIPGLNNPILQDRTALSCAIRAGADGNLYASNGLRNQLVKIDPRTKHISVLQPPPNPLGNLQPFNDLYSSNDGIYLTQTTGNVFQLYSFATQSFTTYQIPTPLSLPLGCFVDSLGRVYIAELLANKILIFDPKTKTIDEYPLPLPLQFPAVVRAERNGWIYFSLFIGNGLGRIHQATHEIQLFHTDRIGGLGAEDTIDGDGGVWLSFFSVDALARLDTGTFEYSYVEFPASLGSGRGIATDVPPYVDVAVNYGPRDAIWFTSVPYNSVGRYELGGLYT